MINRSIAAVLCSLLLCTVSGCKKQTKKAEAPVQSAESASTDIFTAFNGKKYADAQALITAFIENHPSHELVASFRLMIGDIAYEQRQFAQAFEAYTFFQEFYPSDTHAEYAAYKAAYAKFQQAHHISCDSGPVEETLALCKQYKEHQDYLSFRAQMDDLEQTCHRHLLDKELYVVNSYINQSNMNSARHRLGYIKDTFDLHDGGYEKVMFYEAKLAQKEQNKTELSRLLNEMHDAYPESQFTAMADRLEHSGFFG